MKTLESTKVFYPNKFGGKYHAKQGFVFVSDCKPAVELDEIAETIQYEAGFEIAKAHPIVCKKCLKLK
jgi:hypothetical protein